MFGAAGLQQRFVVRPCVADTDIAGVDQLVQSLHLGDVLLADVQQYVNARRDQVIDLMTVLLHCDCLLCSAERVPRALVSSVKALCLQCFDTVSWVLRKASSL